jgi:streptogrisin C
MRPARLARLLGVAVGATMITVPPAAAQAIVTLSPPPPGTIMQSPAEAWAQDAAVYAARYGVSLQQAMARLRAQEASVGETDAIASAYKDRLAGIFVEHLPAYRIVVLLTGDVPVPDRTISSEGIAVPVVFRTGAPASRDALLAAIDRHQAEIRRSLIDPPGMGVDPRTGKLMLAVGAGDADLTGLATIEADIAAIAGVPVHAVVLGRDSNSAVVGGQTLESVDHQAHRRSRCTSGFVVTDGMRTGITTAAHCPDDLFDIAADGSRTPLTMVGAWGARYQDVQIHVAATAMPPLFEAGADVAGVRALSTWRNRPSLRAGDFVCHQGVTSGYSCAEVAMPDYAPPGDLCAGPCPATWVAVEGPTCAHGDSGGPVFLGQTAFGLVKGGSYRSDGRCLFYYFMSTDYLPAGWSLLHR